MISEETKYTLECDCDECSKSNNPLSTSFYGHTESQMIGKARSKGWELYRRAGKCFLVAHIKPNMIMPKL